MLQLQFIKPSEVKSFLAKIVDTAERKAKEMALAEKMLTSAENALLETRHKVLGLSEKVGTYTLMLQRMPLQRRRQSP